MTRRIASAAIACGAALLLTQAGISARSQATSPSKPAETVAAVPAGDAKTHLPPRILTTAQNSLQIPLTPDDLIERLDLIESLDDLLAWVLESCDDVDLDAAVRLFHVIIERRTDRARHTEMRRDYERRDLVVNAACWTWKGQADGDASIAPTDGRPARKARGSVSVAAKR